MGKKVVVSAKKVGKDVKVTFEDVLLACPVDQQVKESMSNLTKAFISIDKLDSTNES